MQKSTEPELIEATAGYIRDVDGNLIPDYDMTLFAFDDGDIVNGEVVRIDRDEVLVDIGYKSEGVIPLKELSIRHDADPGDIVSLGEKIEAVVLQKEDMDGRLILSKKRAEYEKAWIRVDEMSKKGEHVNGKVLEVVKGGLILDIGLRGFLPASLVDIRRVRDLNEFIGQEIECKIIEINRSRNNVVLSRRAVLEEEKKEQREHVLDKLTVGSTVKGCISSIVAFGAFVDLDGIDGLIHISQLSWDHVEHPSEVLSVGDEVEVVVLEVLKDRQRVSLGYKQLTEDPWKQVVNKWPAGTISEGKVTKLVPFGAFVGLEDDIEGLVHISEISSDHVENPGDVLSVGQVVSVKIIDTDDDKRRLGLSIKQTTVKTDEEEKAEQDSGDKEQVKEEPVAAKEKVEIEIVEPAAEEKPKRKRATKSSGDTAEAPEEITETVSIESVPVSDSVVEEKPKKKSLTKKTAGSKAEAEEEKTAAAETLVSESDAVNVDVSENTTLESVLEAIKKDRGSKK